jgi:Fur family ferric uptake transcriptional regulator
MTHQRQVVLEEVRKTKLHLTADEIYERVRKRLPRISMGTVYRNLDLLVSCGLITRIDPGHPQMRFDGVAEEHYHLTCVRCGKVEDAPVEITGNDLNFLESALGRLTKYGIFGHKLEFYGLCSRCAQGEKDPSGAEETADKETMRNGGRK